MSAVNYSIGDNPAYYGETSSGFMESVQNNFTSVTDAISAFSKQVSDQQQTALSDQKTALDASAAQLQTLYQSLFDNNALDSIDFDIEGRAIIDQHATDLRDQAIVNLQAQIDAHQTQMDDYMSSAQNYAVVLEVVSSVTSTLSEVMQYQHDIL